MAIFFLAGTMAGTGVLALASAMVGAGEVIFTVHEPGHGHPFPGWFSEYLLWTMSWWEQVGPHLQCLSLLTTTFSLLGPTLEKSTSGSDHWYGQGADTDHAMEEKRKTKLQCVLFHPFFS
jgi:hypothetical protein